MSAFLHWITATPLRAACAAALVALVAAIVLPVAAWLPASLVVLSALARGHAAAAAAAAGAGAMIVWVFAPVFGTGPALAIALFVVVPSLLAGVALAGTRSLTFVFQALTAGAGLFVLAIHALVGDPQGALTPALEHLQPALQQAAETLSRYGIEQTPAEIGAATLRVAWATLAWVVLMHALLAQFAGLWALGRMREPGLFGREFRGLRLGGFIAWSTVATFIASIAGHQLLAQGWQAADDLLFVLAAAFLVQALAVVHGLRELQVIGAIPVALAYAAAVLAPMALVGIGFADTWFRFRERFAPRQGV